MIVLGLDAGKNTGGALLRVDPRGLATALGHGVIFDHYAASILDRHAAWALTDTVPDLVVVEAPAGHAYPGRVVAVDRLIEAARIGGELAGACRARGWPVLECTASETRGALCGSRSASDARVKVAVLQRVKGWPKRTTSHERDAAVAAIYGAMKVRIDATMAGARRAGAIR